MPIKMKRPRIHAVTDEAPAPDPVPSPLSAEACQLRDELLAGYVIEDRVGVALLQSLVESLDHLRAAERDIARYGRITVDRLGNPRLNPAVRAEAAARMAYLKAFRLLDLQTSPPPKIGRPPSPR